MASKRSSKQEIEKALNAKAKETGRKPTEGSIYAWLTDIGVHPNTWNYDIARVWREGFQDGKPLVRDDVPDSDIAELREAQRDAAATIEQSYRRIYSAAVEKIRSEAQMRVDAADRRVAEIGVERDFLLDSWRATESDRDECRERVVSLEKELADAHLVIAGLQGRLDASNEVIAKLTGSVSRGADVANASAHAGDGIEATGEDDTVPALRHPDDATIIAPGRPDMTELARQLAYGPSADDDDGDGDAVTVIDPGRPDAVSSAGASNADTDEDQPPAIATPSASGGPVAMPIVDDATADQADGGDDDRG